MHFTAPPCFGGSIVFRVNQFLDEEMTPKTRLGKDVGEIQSSAQWEAALLTG